MYLSFVYCIGLKPGIVILRIILRTQHNYVLPLLINGESNKKPVFTECNTKSLLLLVSNITYNGSIINKYTFLCKMENTVPASH